jgi:hypothetical protein
MHVDEKGRTFYAFYVNEALVSKQWAFPSPSPAPLSPAQSMVPAPAPASAQPMVDRPMVYKIGNETFSSTIELLKKLNLSCPPGTSECEINVAPVAPVAAGGSKNKKTSKRRLRSRKASRRKASRRSTSKK